MPSTHGCCYKPSACGANDAPKNCCDKGQPGDGQCGEGEGNCNSDDQCAPGLKCGKNNCPAGMPWTHGCCYESDWKRKSDEDCWKKCGSRSGSCPILCGYHGYCCRKGYSGCPDEAYHVSSSSRHTCVERMPSQAYERACQSYTILNESWRRIHYD